MLFKLVNIRLYIEVVMIKFVVVIILFVEVMVWMILECIFKMVFLCSLEISSIL